MKALHRTGLGRAGAETRGYLKGTWAGKYVIQIRSVLVAFLFLSCSIMVRLGAYVLNIAE